jgi:uncharacterized protein (DUF58 family)
MPAQDEQPARRRYHFHLPGVLYVGVTLLVALGALNSQNNLLFWTLGLAVGALLASGIISGLSLMGVRLERLPMVGARAGEDAQVRYVVRNANRFIPAFGLHVCEVAPARGGGRAAAWTALVAQPHAFVTHLPAKGSATPTAVVRCAARGEARFDQVRVWTTFPFGLTRKSVTFSIPRMELVRPARVPVDPALLDATRGRAPEHDAPDARTGHGDEFFGVREYAPGDALRSVAWRPSARSEQLVVREHAAHRPRRMWIVVRLAPGARTDADEAALRIAGSIVDEALERDLPVGLAVPGAGVHLPPGSGRRHGDRLLLALAALDLARVGRTGTSFPPGAGRDSRCIIVFSGPAEPGFGPPRARRVSALDATIIAPTAKAEGTARRGRRSGGRIAEHAA